MHAQLSSCQMTFGHGAGSDSEGIQGNCLYLGRSGSQLALHQTQATVEVPAGTLDRFSTPERFSHRFSKSYALHAVFCGDLSHSYAHVQC